MKIINSAIKRCFRQLGLDIRDIKYTEEGILRAFLQSLQPAAVLDVGANVGQYAKLVRSSGFGGTIVSFEALLSAHGRLLKRAAADENWIVAPCVALGATRGTVKMNVAANSVSSSVLPMTEAHLTAAPDSEYSGTQETTLETLDHILPDLFAGTGDLFLKIDTQGYETEVLKGASTTLPRVIAIQLEISLIPSYEHAPTLTEIVGLVESLGFELFQLIPGYRDENTGQLMQADGIFKRRRTHG